jgi:hypothetical protein
MRIDDQNIFSFKNTSGEEIPPFGVAIITGATIEENEIVFSIKKCTATEEDLQEPASLIFNGIQPVPNDTYGVGTRDFPLQALIAQPSSDHASGTVVGPKAGSWALSTDGSCLRIMAKDGTDPHVLSGHGVYFIESYHGKTDFYIGKCVTGILGRVGTQMSQGDVTVYEANGSGVLTVVASSQSIQAYNVASEAVLANGWVKVWRYKNKHYCQGIC